MRCLERAPLRSAPRWPSSCRVMGESGKDLMNDLWDMGGKKMPKNMQLEEEQQCLEFGGICKKYWNLENHEICYETKRNPPPPKKKSAASRCFPPWSPPPTKNTDEELDDLAFETMWHANMEDTGTELKKRILKCVRCKVAEAGARKTIRKDMKKDMEKVSGRVTMHMAALWQSRGGGATGLHWYQVW